MLSYNRQNILNRDIKYVLKALKSKNISKGPFLNLFEKKLREYFGSKYCLVVNSATSAFYMLADLLEIKKNDTIIMSPLTFVSGANAFKFYGAKINFVDVSNLDQNLDVSKVEKELEKLNKQKKIVKAIVVTDYAGLPADWKKFKQLSNKYKVKLINDNCHAIGAKYFDKKNYAINYADYVIHSFHAVKNITTGEGGAIYFKKKKDYQKLRSLREHGFNFRLLDKNKFNYDVKFPGFNFRLSELNCGLGISQLSRLNKIVKKRQILAKNYDHLLKNFKEVSIPLKFKNKKNSYHLYPIRINFKKYKINKIDFIKNLENKFSISVQVHYKPTYKFKLYKNYKKINKNFINTESFYSQTISIPLYLSLSLKKQKYIVNSIKKCLKK